MKMKLMFACLVAFGLTACEKDPDMNQLDADFVVYTDHASNVDFGTYATYFIPDSILNAGDVKATYWDDENALAIIHAVEKQMELKGYVRTDKKEDADLGLQLSYLAQANQIVTGGYADYSYGWWNPGFWGSGWGGWYYPYPVVYTFNTNALIIEMVDISQKEIEENNLKIPVIWYAVASGFQYGNGRINMLLLIDGVNQAFRQADYITRN